MLRVHAVRVRACVLSPHLSLRVSKRHSFLQWSVTLSCKPAVTSSTEIPRNIGCVSKMSNEHHHHDGCAHVNVVYSIITSADFGDIAGVRKALDGGMYSEEFVPPFSKRLSNRKFLFVGELKSAEL